MCFLLVSIDPAKSYPLVVAANRDESYERPARPASFWTQHPDLIAGKDLQQGGTWLGMNRRGQFACLTNVRDSRSPSANAPSRGDLVLDYLTTREKENEFGRSLSESQHRYNGFNLVFGSIDGGLFYLSNRNRASAQRLASGVHGLSNGTLNEAWPKVVRGRNRFSDILRLSGNGQPPIDQLLALLADRHIAADVDLPDTGVGIERERTLAPAFIHSPHYGTRCSTVITVRQDGQVNFVEQSFDSQTQTIGRIDEHFAIDLVNRSC